MNESIERKNQLKIRKQTKFLGTLAFLVPSSVSLSTLDLGNFSFHNLFTFSGGAQSRLGDLNYEIDQKMNVGDNAKKLQDIQHRDLMTSEVKGVNESIDFDGQEEINDKDSNNTIKTIYTEIMREDKAIKLDQDSTSKSNEYQKKSRPHIQNYLSVKEKVDRFAESLQSVHSRRSKRSVKKQSSDYPRLNKNERGSLWEMYKLFEELDKERENFRPRMQEINSDSPISMSSIGRPQTRMVEASLQAISWKTKDDVEYTTARRGAYGKGGKPNVWLNWSQNPYKSFLEDQTKYTTLVEAIEKANREKEAWLQKNRARGLFGLLFGPGIVRAAYSGQGPYDSKVSNARADLANYVALKMLSWMGQYKFPTGT